MIPLWMGVIPFAVAYAVTARAAGLSVFETSFMSATTFAGASQVAAAGLFAKGATGLGVVLTVFLMNVRHLLYGLSLAKSMLLTPWQRSVAAQFLTDEAYGMTVVKGKDEPGGLSFAFLLGTEFSLFVVWNATTLLGALLGAVLPAPETLGVAVIFPLAFLGLLVPLLVDRLHLVVALASGLGGWALSKVLPGGLMILVAGVGGALLGAALHTRLHGPQHEQRQGQP